MNITTLGIDLAKNIFHVHGVDKAGQTVLQKRLSRDQLSAFIANTPSCLIGMEACGGSNYWARQFQSFGHNVKLMGAQFVKPYVKSNKNDWLDAEAICEAVQRPSMRFVSVKETWQQDIQSLHRSRSLFVKNKVALCNQIRGLLAEYGLVVKQGVSPLVKQLPIILEDTQNELTPISRELFLSLYEDLKTLIEKVKDYDKKIVLMCKNNDTCQKLTALAGVGPMVATAMVATIGDANVFKNGREMSAYIGLVPKQYSTGGKQKLLGISKRGDCYLRGLLIHGARAVLYSTKHLSVEKTTWLQTLAQRRGANKAMVALANKNVRIMWALMTKQEAYRAA